MSTLMTSLTTVFNTVISWFTSIFSTITGSPILTLMIVGFVTVGFAFGLVRRLIHS